MAEKRLATRRLFAKFLIVQMPVFVLATVVGLALLSLTFLREEQNLLNARVGNLSARVSGLVARAPAGSTLRELEQIIGVLLADPAIMCAELGNSSGLEAAAPPRLGCKGQTGLHTLKVPVGSAPGRRLSVYFSDAELMAVKANKRQFTQMALVVGLLMGTLASWFAFSLFVGRPVSNLLRAIQSSAAAGRSETVQAIPDDELGTVITAFNGMQQRLGEQSRQSAEALARLEHIYNETPGLMLSLCATGTITSTSGYVLEKLGYERGELTGARFASLLRDPERFAPHVGQEVRDLPLTLKARDGQTVDVLFSAARAPDGTGAHNDFLCVLSDVTRLNALGEELRLQAVTDELTGLPNRKGLMDYLAALGGEPAARTRDVSVLFIDLDNFKWVNDTHGHEAGDGLLRMAAGRLRATLGADDFVARLGGDEFAVVLRAPGSCADAKAAADRIIAAMLQPFDLWQVRAYVGCSIGIAGPLRGSADAAQLLRLADLAMYRAKQEGRNRAVIYSADLRPQGAVREADLSTVHAALENRQLRLFYQPIVDLAALKPSGAEALLRIAAGQEAPSPAAFIRIAEENGLIGRVGDFVVDTGLRTGSRLFAGARHGLAYLSINLSPRQLDSAFMAALLDKLRADPATARHITFEITETTLLNHEDRISAFFAEARSLGARIALDDFGTGYSSLSHVTRYPVDIVKLDRNFVRNIDNHRLSAVRRNQALIKAAATLCRELNMQIIAEGIETQAELETLRDFGIAYGQGYLFSRALPEQAFESWLDAFTAPRQDNLAPAARAARL
jgi:diguanylate cyclase (GGDEF)-like protein